MQRNLAVIIICSIVVALLAFGGWPPTARAEVELILEPGPFELRDEPVLDPLTNNLAQAIDQEKHDPDLIRELIANGAQVNAVYDQGRTILTTAIRNNAPLQIVQILLEAGADPNQPGSYGRTALMLSTRLHKRPELKSEIVQGRVVQKHTFFGAKPQPEASVFLALLKAGADPNQKDENGETAGFSAAANPNPVFIKSFLEAGGRIDVPNDLGRTVLMEAAYYNSNPEIIDLLLQSGARVDSRDYLGFSSLHYSAYFNQTLAVSQTLLSAGADPNTKNSQGLGMQGMSPTFMAAANPNLEVIRAFIKAGGRLTKRPDDAMTMLMLAAGENTNPEIVDFLIKAGESIEAADKKGASAIHYAAESAKSEQVPILSALVAAGADPHLTDLRGRTVWHCAIPGRSLNEFHQALLDLGVDVNRADHDGLTPLLESVKSGSDEHLTAFLIKAGADIKAVDKNGRSAVMLALDHIPPKLEQLKVLLKAGADPNLADANGRTPLIMTVTGDSITRKALMLLLQNGADANGRDAAGNSALHYASASDQHYKYVMADDLLEAGADPNAANHLGQTPLMWAASKRENPEETLGLLIFKGASLDSKSHDGRSVLDWASSNTNPAVAETLKKLGAK